MTMETTTPRPWITRRIEAWSARRNPAGAQAELNRRNILILPTAHGILFILATLVVFIAAINYGNSLAFGLAFFMVSLFIICMFHGFNNLHGLRLKALPTRPVFRGEDAAFQVLLSRHARRSHEGIELFFRGFTVSKASLVDHEEEQVSVFIRSTKRGEFKAPSLTVRGQFPSGLFTAWSIVRLEMRCLVYPEPVPVALHHVLNSGGGITEESPLVREGSEDFHGFRSFNPGDSLKQVAWKNVARGQGMLVKQFVDYLDQRLWLDWDMFYGFPDEDRLSRLCYCVLKLSSANTTYGLKLPGLEIAPETGKGHRLQVLQALARYRVPSAREADAGAGEQQP